MIILDEIQNAPKALESLKYFCKETPEYHIIAAGSLLGVAIHEGVSYPVGKVDLLDLYPLNFREFLYAMGEKKLADELKTKDYSIMSDCWGALSELPATSILEGNDIFIEFKGALTEQYVLQQLISDTPYTPYYYGTEKATFEQDFLIQKETAIIPIEVKAETNIRSQSLKAYCDKFHPEKAVRFSTLKYMDQEWMVNIPLYAVCNL